jgi:hypothetical protein
MDGLVGNSSRAPVCTIYTSGVAATISGRDPTIRMRILLLHPEDSPLVGPWLGQRWNAVYDLARSGWDAYERWSGALGCPVKPIDGIRDGLTEIHKVSELLKLGLGHLVDREGLDWWELTAIMVHQRLESLVLLWKLANDVPRDGEVWITRDGFEANALRLRLGTRLHLIPSTAAQSRKGLRHYADRLRHLPIPQVLQILGDKYDAGYRVRRHFHSPPRRSGKPVVLVPSSYINMSLTAIAYARLAPDNDFLLVSTRSSGKLKEVPANVTQAWLASYAGDSSADEYREILQRWGALEDEIESVPELAALGRLALTDDFPRRFADGLAIRNAWLRVLSLEPVEAVLCCDDSNPHTHIPLLLGRRRGLPAIACHHGALDGRYLIKTCHADVILAKGRMELDYLVQTCGVDSSIVEIGAPGAPEYVRKAGLEEGDWIIFFSEPYEATAGRTEEIYRDVIPGLADLARRTGKTLVVKLHPSENLSDRQNLAEKSLTREQSGAIRWLTGRFGVDLLQRTWFGVTVQSSTAVECAVHGVPCFLCEWLDLWPYGYIAQYRKFRVGIGLGAAEEIASIPEKLAAYKSDPTIAEDCWEAISPETFVEILEGRSAANVVPLRMQQS